MKKVVATKIAEKTTFYGKVRKNANKCDICNKELSTTYWLKRHLTSHKRNTIDNTGKRIKCEICNKQLKDRGHLQSHLLAHERNTINKTGKLVDETGKLIKKRYLKQCDICDKTLLDNQKLKQHKLAHKRNIIDETGKRLCSKNDRKCTLCQKQFLQKSNLERHKLAHHKINMYEIGDTKENNTNTFSGKLDPKILIKKEQKNDHMKEPMKYEKLENMTNDLLFVKKELNQLKEELKEQTNNDELEKTSDNIIHKKIPLNKQQNEDVLAKNSKENHMSSEFTKAQEEILECYLNQFPWMVKRLILKISKETNLDPKKIINWFKARKCRYIKQNQIEILQKRFDECHNITHEMSIKIFKETQLGPKIILKWFKIQLEVHTEVKNMIKAAGKEETCLNKEAIKNFMWCNCENYMESLKELQEHMKSEHNTRLFHSDESTSNDVKTSSSPTQFTSNIFKAACTENEPDKTSMTEQSTEKHEPRVNVSDSEQFKPDKGSKSRGKVISEKEIITLLSDMSSSSSVTSMKSSSVTSMTSNSVNMSASMISSSVTSMVSNSVTSMTSSSVGMSTLMTSSSVTSMIPCTTDMSSSSSAHTSKSTSSMVKDKAGGITGSEENNFQQFTNIDNLNESEEFSDINDAVSKIIDKLDSSVTSKVNYSSSLCKKTTEIPTTHQYKNKKTDDKHILEGVHNISSDQVVSNTSETLKGFTVPQMQYNSGVQRMSNDPYFLTPETQYNSSVQRTSYNSHYELNSQEIGNFGENDFSNAKPNQAYGTYDMAQFQSNLNRNMNSYNLFQATSDPYMSPLEQKLNHTNIQKPQASYMSPYKNFNSQFAQATHTSYMNSYRQKIVNRNSQVNRDSYMSPYKQKVNYQKSQLTQLPYMSPYKQINSQITQGTGNSYMSSYTQQIQENSPYNHYSHQQIDSELPQNNHSYSSINQYNHTNPNSVTYQYIQTNLNPDQSSIGSYMSPYKQNLNYPFN